MTAYYNEIDPKAAAWLRELIKAGVIAPGVVDERSIVDVTAADVRGFTQCHWFAGIGVWSYSLRRAGVGDDQRVWTASLPCQPFSAAGRQKGFEDERHLWPFFERLVGELSPSIVYGEQVASKAVDAWLDVVSIDMEKLGLAFAAIAFPAAGVGAPHIRDRTYWLAAKPGALADAASRRIAGGVWIGGSAEWSEGAAGGYGAAGGVADTGREGVRAEGSGAAAGAPGGVCAEAWQRERLRTDAGTGGAVAGGVADAYSRECDGLPVVRGLERDGADARRPQGSGESEPHGNVRGLADTHHAGLEGRGVLCERGTGLAAGSGGVADGAPAGGPVNGFWANPDWLLCRDGKWRPVEPGTSPLATGAPARVGRLRGYGNGLCSEAARIWIETSLEVAEEAEA